MPTPTRRLATTHPWQICWTHCPSTERSRLRLPNPAAILLYHRGIRLAVERLLKFRHIRDHAVGPVFLRRMGIRRRSQTLDFVAFVRAPALPVPDEEALLGGQPINQFQLLAFGRLFPRHVREDEPAEVRCIFPKRQLTVDFDVVHNRVPGVLLRNTSRPLLEFLSVLRGPPILQIARSVELAPLVVETVSELVPDRPARVAVIGSIILCGVKQRRL